MGLEGGLVVNGVSRLSTSSLVKQPGDADAGPACSRLLAASHWPSIGHTRAPAPEAGGSLAEVTAFPCAWLRPAADAGAHPRAGLPGPRSCVLDSVSFGI